MPAPRHGWRAALASLSVIALATAATAQVTWEGFPARRDTALGFDAQVGRLVLFGGRSTTNVTLDDTWGRAGSASWGRLQPGTAPPPSSGHAMSRAPAGTGGVILYGGVQGGVVSDVTWEYTGNNWSQRAPAVRPPARTGHALSFDPVRNVVVLFGGVGRNDTWEWDGNTWSQRFPATSPPAMSGHGMAHEGNTNRTVLVATSQQCWLWDGTTWTQTVSFPGFSGAGVNFGFTLSKAPGGNGVLLWGGQEPPFVFSGMARFDGATWSTVSQGPRPPARAFHFAAHDAARDVMVIYGGSADNFSNIPVYTDTWEWNGTSWTQRPEDLAPARRTDTNVAYDAARDEVVLFGGHVGPDSILPESDTWVRSGRTWSQRSPTSRPSGRGGHGMAWDSVRNVAVLFGGCVVPPGSGCGCCDTSVVGGTWEWNGATWAQRSPSTVPLHRAFVGMAFDAARNNTLMFGGVRQLFTTGYTVLDETWQWNGSNWLQRFPALRPSPRYGAAMAYSPAQQWVLLFGGRPASGPALRDTWAWIGSIWIPLSPATVPPALPLGTNPMTWDSARGRLVLAWSGQVWEWLGTDWVQRTPVEPGGGGPNAFDASLARVVSHDGTTWEYGPVFAATARMVGVGCAGSAGVPELRPRNLPWAGDRQAFDLVNLPAPAGSFAIFGFSDQSWRGTPLPWHMSGIGMPTCFLRVEPSITEFVVGTFWDFGVPNVPEVLGVEFFTQLMVVDPAAGNAAGFTVTNSVAGVAGAR